MVLTPNYTLLLNGSPVSDVFKRAVIEIGIKDEVELVSDELTLKLTKPIDKPLFGDRFEFALGYGSERFDFGSFTVQTVNESVLSYTIQATGVDYGSSLKEKKNKSYENLSLKELVEQLANRNGLDVRCDFDDLFFKYISQTHESDLNFLRRLSEKYGAIFNIKKNTVVFLKKTTETLTEVSFDVNALVDLNIKHLAKIYYNSCQTLHWNTKENKKVETTVGSGDPIFIMKGFFNTQDEAKIAAKNKLKTLQADTVQGSFQAVGVKLYAGWRVRLVNPIKTTYKRGSPLFFSIEGGAVFSVKSVNHTLGRNGWKINVNFNGC